MKSSNNIKKSILLNLVFALILFSCNDLDENLNDLNKNLKTTKMPDMSEILNLKAQSTMAYSDTLLDYTILTMKEKRDVLTNLFIDDTEDYEVSNIVLFMDINSNDINNLAIEYFSVHDDQGFFDFYSSDSTKEFSFETSAVSMEQLLKLNYSFNDSNDIVMILDEKVNHNPIKNHKSYEDLSLFIEMKFFEKAGQNPVIVDEPISGYDYACGHVGGCRSGGGICNPSLWYCQTSSSPSTCPKNSTQSHLEQNTTISEGEITSLFIDQKYYDFRDQFLDHHFLTKKYRNLFYRSSLHFKQSLNTEIALDIFNILPEINDAVTKIINNNQNDVILSNSLVLDINEILEKLKLNTKSNVFVSLIDEFKADISLLKDKKRNEINLILQE